MITLITTHSLQGTHRLPPDSSLFNCRVERTVIALNLAATGLLTLLRLRTLSWQVLEPLFWGLLAHLYIRLSMDLFALVAQQGAGPTLLEALKQGNYESLRALQWLYRSPRAAAQVLSQLSATERGNLLKFRFKLADTCALDVVYTKDHLSTALTLCLAEEIPVDRRPWTLLVLRNTENKTLAALAKAAGIHAPENDLLEALSSYIIAQIGNWDALVDFCQRSAQSPTIEALWSLQWLQTHPNQQPTRRFFNNPALLGAAVGPTRIDLAERILVAIAPFLDDRNWRDLFWPLLFGEHSAIQPHTTTFLTLLPQIPQFTTLKRLEGGSFGQRLAALLIDLQDERKIESVLSQKPFHYCQEGLFAPSSFAEHSDLQRFALYLHMSQISPSDELQSKIVAHRSKEGRHASVQQAMERQEQALLSSY